MDKTSWTYCTLNTEFFFLFNTRVFFKLHSKLQGYIICISTRGREIVVRKKVVKKGKERGGREGKDCMTNWVNGLKNDVSFWALQINRRRKKKKKMAHLCSWGKNIFN